MSTERGQRSAAAAAASRRNGARSKGPRSAAGKAAAARNSRKHGLFAAGLADEVEAGPAAAEFNAYMAELASDEPGAALVGQVAQIAAARLARADRLLTELWAQLLGDLDAEPLDHAQLAALIGQIARLARHQRRFRGQRDRALRRLIGEQAVRQRYLAGRRDEQ